MRVLATLGPVSVFRVHMQLLGGLHLAFQEQFLLEFDRVEENGDAYYWIRNRTCSSVVIHILKMNGVLSLSRFWNSTAWKKIEQRSH